MLTDRLVTPVGINLQHLQRGHLCTLINPIGVETESTARTFVGSQETSSILLARAAIPLSLSTLTPSSARNRPGAATRPQTEPDPRLE